MDIVHGAEWGTNGPLAQPAHKAVRAAQRALQQPKTATTGTSQLRRACPSAPEATVWDTSLPQL